MSKTTPEGQRPTEMNMGDKVWLKGKNMSVTRSQKLLPCTTLTIWPLRYQTTSRTGGLQTKTPVTHEDL